MKTEITENIEDKTNSYNILVPFNVPGKPEIGVVDLNKIFQVNFNFDSLKILLEGLITAYKKTQEELENINAYNKVKTKKMENLIEELVDLNILDENFFDKKENTINNEEIKKDNLTLEKSVKKSNKMRPKSSRINRKIHAPTNNDLKLELQVGYDEVTKNIIKKVNGFELSINDLVEAVPLMQKEQNNNTEYINNLEEELNELKSKINNLTKENNTIKKKLKENEEKNKDINTKLKEMNIFDALNNNQMEDGDKKTILGIISNLDKKLNMKLKFLEEKISKIDSDAFKTEKETQNIKNTQDMSKMQIDKIKEKLDEINTKEENINLALEQNKENIKDKLDNKLTDLEKQFNISLNNLKTENNIKKENDKAQVSPKKEQVQNINLEKNPAFKSLKEAIKELNKKIKELNYENEIEQLKFDISALKSGIKNFVLLPDFKELKDLSDENNEIIRKVREDFEDFQIAQNVSKDITNINLKLESLTNKIHDINDRLSKKGDKIVFKSNNDYIYKFVEYSIFDEFKSHITKEFNNINDNFNNSRKLLFELIDSVKNRISFKDLKILEDAMMSQMDDMKNAFSKKFADKNEVNRGIKYLDQQIKNIIQIYIKKIEKGDNWLLAKKPISNNNICASCESFIGELNNSNDDNNIYIPWSKYQTKDSNDKLYRIGQGYSKMLQELQFDENDKKREIINNNIINMNKTEYSLNLGFNGKKLKINNDIKRNIQQNLPKLKEKQSLKKANSTLNENTDLYLKTENNAKDDEPIITKIFRVNKEQH